jgi:hypothetical protein
MLQHTFFSMLTWRKPPLTDEHLTTLAIESFEACAATEDALADLPTGAAAEVSYADHAAALLALDHRLADLQCLLLSGRSRAELRNFQILLVAQVGAWLNVVRATARTLRNDSLHRASQAARADDEARGWREDVPGQKQRLQHELVRLQRLEPDFVARLELAALTQPADAPAQNGPLAA